MENLSSNEVYTAIKESRDIEEFKDRKLLRRLDGQFVILEGYGMETDIADLFNPHSNLFSLDIFHEQQSAFATIKKENIENKRVLVVPSYGENAFIFSFLGAKEVVGVDADKRTVDWLNLLQQYYGNQHLGEILLSQVSYPDYTARMRLIDQKIIQFVKYYRGQPLVETLYSVVKHNEIPKPLANLSFHHASLGSMAGNTNISEIVGDSSKGFDFIYLPYILGIDNGIETVEEINEAYEQIYQLTNPDAKVMIAPFAGTKDLVGMFSEKGTLAQVRNLVPRDKFEIDYETALGDKVIGVLTPIK